MWIFIILLHQKNWSKITIKVILIKKNNWNQTKAISSSLAFFVDFFLQKRFSNEEALQFRIQQSLQVTCTKFQAIWQFVNKCSKNSQANLIEGLSVIFTLCQLMSAKLAQGKSMPLWFCYEQHDTSGSFFRLDSIHCSP